MVVVMIKQHLSYLKYVLKHKWFVYIAGRRIGLSFWQSFQHDLSKFRFSEWFAYADTFYNPDGSRKIYAETPEFQKAWLYHQHRNLHHWQSWLLRMDRGDVIPLQMPKKYVLEMVADWMGAGKAITGKWEYQIWYNQNREKIILHPQTREFVENILILSLF